MAEHTQLPWIVGDNHMMVRTQNTVAAIADCGTAADWLTFADCEANAAFIVRACNAHDDLLEACKKMRKRLTELANDGDHCWADWSTSYQVDAAITKATEPKP